MAVLSKIRQRSFVLIVIIALALFSFVLADVIQSGGFGSNSNHVGSVNGTDISSIEFMQKVAQVEKQGQNTSNTQAVNSVWEQQVRSIIIGDQIEKLGLGIAGEQLVNVIKENPFFAQNPQFLNAAGSFDENKFREFVKSIKNDPNQDRWREWQNFEAEVEKSAVEQLYYSLIKGGVYTTKAEGKFKYMVENKKAAFDYVMVPYSSINDDEVKVSDEEIITYMKKNAKKYKSDNTRSIEYVLIENKPSDEDEKAMENAINEVIFGKVVYNDKTQQNDTLPPFRDVVDVAQYVNANSDIKFDSTYLAKSQLPVEYQEQLFNLSNGEVFGPYVYNDFQCVSKMIDKKANASAKASHILISFQGAERSSATRTKEEAQVLANDLLAKAKANPAGFAQLADANTDDPGSKGKGGEYDNIMPGQMVPKFNDFVFNNPVGSIGLVETEFGFHIIKVSDKYSSVLLGTVAQRIEPSSQTIDAIYTKASKLEADATTKSFEEITKAAGLTIMPAGNIRAFDEFIAGLGAQREIVRWSFNEDTNVGSVKRFETTQGYVIAKLKEKNDTGLLSLENARESVGVILRNEKKAEIIKNKMTGSSLEEVAKATGSSVLTANDVILANTVIPNVGQEPKVVGTAFSLAAGKISQLINGNSGVFIIKSKSVTEAPAVNSFSNQITQEMQMQQNNAQMRAYEALKDKAKIKDNRFQF